MTSQQLMEITVDDIERSPPENFTGYAKVVSVHNGDTCDLVIIRHGILQRYECRLEGINASALKTGMKALKSRDFLAWLSIGKDPDGFPHRSNPWSEDELQQILNNNNQVLVCAEFRRIGRYGKPLVTLKKNPNLLENYFNNLLVENGYAEADEHSIL